MTFLTMRTNILTSLQWNKHLQEQDSHQTATNRKE